MNVWLTKPGIEKVCCAELRSYGIDSAHYDSGIVAATNSVSSCFDLCFSTWHSPGATPLTNRNGIKADNEIIDFFCESIKDKKIDAPWPLIWLKHSENGYVTVSGKSLELAALLKKRMSRIAKLAISDYPSWHSMHSGLFIIETPSQIIAATECIFYGQRRMKDDPRAPSRSYLKIEEALAIFGQEPSAQHIVVDLGAAPGGWSYAAAHRGATVYAIDNGPLKKGAADHIRIYHERADAFRWQPQQRVDWLFCDMVDLPQKVMPRIQLWVKNRWCRFGVVNFKYGHSDPNDVLSLVRSPDGLLPLVSELHCRHLFHDRDEITVMFKV